jgi:hypothetical protein
VKIANKLQILGEENGDADQYQYDIFYQKGRTGE